MKGLNAAAALGVMALSLVGCVPQTRSDYGNKKIADPKIVAQIEKGKSTKADVKTILGDPMSVDFTDAGFEKWVYVHSTSQVKGGTFTPTVDTQSDTLTVQFDKEGVVMNVGGGHTTGDGGTVQDAKK